MVTGRLFQLLRHSLGRDGAAPGTDGQLLERFVHEHDEASFEEVIRRHSNMVFRVCRRVLHNDADAEDAFQAAFIVLLRKAGGLRGMDSVAGWLYKVAYRIALKANARADRRQTHERQAATDEMHGEPAGTVAEEASWNDVRPVLDEELNQLPEKYRLPVILCYLQGQTTEAAASALGCPKGTILSRLARGRERLRDRLARRGLALSAGTFAAMLGRDATAGTVPPTVVAGLLQGVRQVTVGQAGAFSASTVALADATVWPALGLTRWVVLGGVLLLAAALLLGTTSVDSTNFVVSTPSSGSWQLRLTLRGHTRGVNAVAFATNGRWLATASSDKTVRLWDPATGDLLTTLPGHTAEVHSLAFSRDSRTLASGSGQYAVQPGEIRLWDPATEQQLRLIERADTVRVRSLAFSHDGALLASGGWDGARLWTVATGAPYPGPPLKRQANAVRGVTFSRDDRTLLMGSAYFPGLKRWNLATGTPEARPRGPQAEYGGDVLAVALSPDNQWLATGSNDDTAATWDAATGQRLRTFRGHQDDVTAVAVSPDGRLLATASRDRTVKIWDPATGRHLATLTTHTGSVTSLSFAPNGRTLATASADRTVRLWDVSH